MPVPPVPMSILQNCSPAVPPSPNKDTKARHPASDNCLHLTTCAASCRPLVGPRPELPPRRSSLDGAEVLGYLCHMRGKPYRNKNSSVFRTFLSKESPTTTHNSVLAQHVGLKQHFLKAS